MTKRIVTAALAALFVAGAQCPKIAHAQAAPVIVVSDSIKTQWAQWQQWIHEGQTAYDDYQQFKIAYQNFQRYRSGGSLVDVITPLTALEHDINSALHDGKDPALAAELAQNTFLKRNVALINLALRMGDKAAGSAQLMEVMNMMMATVASNNMQQSEVDYAKAQDALNREQAQSNLRKSADSSNWVP